MKEDQLNKRNGLIPGWSEIANLTRVERLSPKERKMLFGYYRAQRRIAEGRQRRGARIIRALEKDSFFREFERTQGVTLSQISSLVRGPVEKRQR